LFTNTHTSYFVSKETVNVIADMSRYDAVISCTNLATFHRNRPSPAGRQKTVTSWRWQQHVGKYPLDCTASHFSTCSHHSINQNTEQLQTQTPCTTAEPVRRRWKWRRPLSTFPRRTLGGRHLGQQKL